MKFYSEELKALFNSAEELEKAEAEHKAKTEGKTKAMNDIVARFEVCIKEINNIVEDIAKISEDLSPAEERQLIHMLVESMSSLALPMFWQI